MQRQIQEASHREQLFTEFIDQASKIYAEGILQARLDDPAKLVPVYACINKLRLFCKVEQSIEAAQSVLERIVETSKSPPSALEAGKARIANHDILRTFADCCRAELTHLRRHPGKPSIGPGYPVPQLTRPTV